MYFFTSEDINSFNADIFFIVNILCKRYRSIPVKKIKIGVHCRKFLIAIQ